ncbi:MAG TPA: hypothetical protein VFE23_02110 [Usitatibacter sp.]|jgi:hypothetical protein|nr:hypothetical protein [Usitatibacter sp.]
MAATLAVPGERFPPPPELEIRPKALKAWAEGLPLAQTLESSRKLAVYLAALNGARVAADVRLELLEASRPFADLLLEELDDIYTKSAQPLGPRGRDALANARQLASELALGYQVAASDTAAKRLGFGIRKQLTLQLVRAAQYLAHQVRASYKAYSPVPTGTWKALHTLYLVAAQEQLVAEPAENPDGLTVAQVYCETLLVSLTDAYRLAPGDVDRVVAQIRSLRAPVTLGQQRPATRPGGHFIVPCDTDRAPKPALSANDDTGGPNWRLLDANPVVERLRARKQALDSGNVSATLTRAMGEDGTVLLGKLMVLWGDPPKRAYRRDASDMTVAICVGLKAISHFVAHDAKVDASTQELALRKGITMPLPAMTEDESARMVPIYEWAVVNQSAGGLKVRRAQGALQPLAVGEIIGIRAPGKPEWTVAVLRWITTLEDGGAEFGLQYIGTALRSVWVQPTISAAPQSKQGLLVADEDSPGAQILAAVPNTYSELREFDLQGEGYSARVRAAGLIELTGRFDLFHLSAS